MKQETIDIKIQILGAIEALELALDASKEINVTLALGMVSKNLRAINSILDKVGE